MFHSRRDAMRLEVAGLPGAAREELARVDQELFRIWNLGDNALLAWSHADAGILVLSVRHYAIAESIHARDDHGAAMQDAAGYINEILAGPKHLAPDEFARVCGTFDSAPHAVRCALPAGDTRVGEAISEMVRCYGVSLVRNRAVVLLDAVAFSLRSPLDQMSMLNSLAYSVNSAYGQLLTKGIEIDFARTTTGDGFYIWNRATTPEANTELYKLMMLLLADNAIAQGKARSPWVPKLRAAFHVGEHYEFHQVEGLNPTNFSYIVGQVTVDLQRMVEHALPGQILLGDFVAPLGDAGSGRTIRHDTLAFVENTAATLEQLAGLDISGGRIRDIRCYLTGFRAAGGNYLVNRYRLVDKHGTTRAVYNAKINIHRESAEPVFLGLQSEDLGAFKASRVESLGPLQVASVSASASAPQSTLLSRPPRLAS
jgi:hypothetical protein